MQIHDRDAHDAVLETLQRVGAPERTVFHCFSGDDAMARIAADEGYYLSFAGNLTFKNAQNLRDALAVTPRERILVETDAPFLTPDSAPRAPERAVPDPAHGALHGRRARHATSTSCARSWPRTRSRSTARSRAERGRRALPSDCTMRGHVSCEALRRLVGAVAAKLRANVCARARSRRALTVGEGHPPGTGLVLGRDPVDVVRIEHRLGGGDVRDRPPYECQGHGRPGEREPPGRGEPPHLREHAADELPDHEPAEHAHHVDRRDAALKLHRHEPLTHGRRDRAPHERIEAEAEHEGERDPRGRGESEREVHQHLERQAHAHERRERHALLEPSEAEDRDHAADRRRGRERAVSDRPHAEVLGRIQHEHAPGRRPGHVEHQDDDDERAHRAGWRAAIRALRGSRAPSTPMRHADAAAPACARCGR